MKNLEAENPCSMGILAGLREQDGQVAKLDDTAVAPIARAEGTDKFCND